MAEDEVVSQLESVDDYVNPLKLLKSTSKNKNNIVISYLNVNSIRNKLDDVRNLILDNVDILCISESKLDSSFPIGQFSVPGFKQPVRLDVSDKSGGLLLFCRDYLPFRQLHCPVLNEDIQCIVSDLNLRKQKWLILSIYRNPKQNIRYFLDEITNVLDYYSSSYENIIIMGDFNEEITQSHMNNFLSQFSLYSLIKKPTCYKSSDGRCIDLILTNKNRSFQKSNSFETGISDHHNLIYTMFKTTYEKSPPQVVHFRSFRNFSFEYFQKDLTNCLDQSKPGDFDSFSERFESVLDVHVPKKKRTIRGNQKHPLTKTLRQAIMRRSFLKNRATRTGNAYYYELYKKQRNYVVNLNRKAKESYFQTLETSADFWKSTKHLFSKGSHVRESILLLDDHNNVEKNQHIFSHMLNTYFVNITNTLDLTSWETCLDADIDDIELILKEYSNHPSIKLISRSTDSSKLFSFANVTPDQVHRVILDLDPKKSVSGPIPSKIVRMVADIISSPIAQCLNSAIKFSTFPQSLKLADISPIFKKGDKFLKENYRPISILPSFSKIFEKVLFSQLTGYFDSILHPHICGFRSKHNTQHALLRMIGKWHQCLDRSGKVGAILMDLSKAFDCIEHDLLIAKLAAYGLDRASLKLVKCYLSNRYQRTKVGGQ
jgi:exonuclease III